MLMCLRGGGERTISLWLYLRSSISSKKAGSKLRRRRAANQTSERLAPQGLSGQGAGGGQKAESAALVQHGIVWFVQRVPARHNGEPPHSQAGMEGRKEDRVRE